jgi:hypothetical protein
MNEPRRERPVGARPQEERSDWTEQDLLTVDEALPRLLDAIAEAEAEAEASTDPAERDETNRRLEAMYEARRHLEANRAARSGP